MKNALLTATKEYTWDMAHMLCGHKGLCKNLHGHTYKLLVTVARRHSDVNEELKNPEEGMVIDFKALKEIVHDIIVDPLDHCTMINSNTTSSFENELWRLLNAHEKKIVVVPYRPTAENMVKDFAERLQYQFDSKLPEIALMSVRLYETPTSYAEYTL